MLPRSVLVLLAFMCPGSRLVSGLQKHQRSGTDASDPVGLLAQDPEPGLGGNLSRGVAFIKLSKVGGSTFAGVMRRVAVRHGMSHARDGGKEWETAAMNGSAAGRPGVWANHGARWTLGNMLEKYMPEAFYVTIVRNPADACMSSFYHFGVTRGHKPNNDEEKVKFITDSPWCDNGASLVALRRDQHSTQPADEVLLGYDIVGTTERFDETLLVLARMLNVSMVDILYLKAKESGKRCTDKNDIVNGEMAKHPPVAAESQEVRAALAAKFDTSDDRKLYEAADARLSRSAEEYGRPQLAADLQQFQGMLASVEEQCRQHFFEDCLWNDNGCGQTCIDHVAAQSHWE